MGGSRQRRRSQRTSASCVTALSSRLLVRPVPVVWLIRTFEGGGAYARAMAADRSRKARAARRRTRRMQRVEHDLSDDQWAALKGAWGGCAYCGATGRP